MPNDLINGVYRLLGELPDAPRRGLHLAHSLVTGELVTLALPIESTPSAKDLRREGEIFGDIAHRNVHRIVDRGGDEIFIAWEYLPAWPLTDTLESGRPVSIPVVLRLLADIGNGLGALHSRGLVYRGLHPGRILVSRDRRVRLATCPDALSTGRGRAAGVGPPSETPIRYLPPEQIEGMLDSRVDIYTAGAIGYELLTGRKLYANADPVTLAVQILKTTPEPPSALRPDVPPELDDFLLHCLARDADERPAGSSSFLAHLRKLMELIGPESEDGFAQLSASGPICFPLVSTTPAEAPRELEPRSGGFAVQRLDEAGDSAAVVVFEAKVSGSRVDVPATGLEFGANGRSEETGGNGHVTRSPNGNGHGNAARNVNAERKGNAEGNSNADGLRGPAVGRYMVEPAAVITPPGYDDVLTVVTPNGNQRAVTSRRLLVGRGETVVAHGGLDLSSFDVNHVVSRNHAELVLAETGWVCRDLGATNGTFLNGNRVPSHGEVSIQPGDQLSFAAVVVAVEGVPEWATS